MRQGWHGIVQKFIEPKKQNPQGIEIFVLDPCLQVPSPGPKRTSLPPYAWCPICIFPATFHSLFFFFSITGPLSPPCQIRNFQSPPSSSEDEKNETPGSIVQQLRVQHKPKDFPPPLIPNPHHPFLCSLTLNPFRVWLHYKRQPLRNLGDLPLPI